MGKFDSSKRLLKMAGGGMLTQHTPLPPWNAWIRLWLYNNKKWLQILKDVLNLKFRSRAGAKVGPGGLTLPSP